MKWRRLFFPIRTNILQSKHRRLMNLLKFQHDMGLYSCNLKIAICGAMENPALYLECIEKGGEIGECGHYFGIFMKICNKIQILGKTGSLVLT